jgi:hypothetical protein
MLPPPKLSVPGPVKRALAATASVSAGALERTAEAVEDARRVASFLRGHFAFRAQPTDVFVASYPRSGATLLTWMLHLLLHEEDAPPTHINQVAPWYERSLATGELRADDFERFAAPRVFKSHLPREWLPDGARYVYVVRDGRDVAVSYYHFYRDYLRFQGSFDAFFDRFLAGRLQYGSWFKHVAGWRSHVGDPSVLVLAYEEVVRDREATARKLLEHLEVSADDARVRRAVAGTSFEAMKAKEPVFDHATALLVEHGVTPRSFLRTGRTGAGEETLDATQERAFERRSTRAAAAPELRLASFLQ